MERINSLAAAFNAALTSSNCFQTVRAYSATDSIRGFLIEALNSLIELLDCLSLLAREAVKVAGDLPSIILHLGSAMLEIVLIDKLEPQ